MKIPFAKMSLILRFEASCEKKTKLLRRGVQSGTIFKEHMKLSVFKKTLIKNTIETTKKLRDFFFPLCLLQIKLPFTSFFDCVVKPVM